MNLFNTNQYPIHQMDNMSAELDTLRQRYKDEGVIVLDNFLTPTCMAALLEEAIVSGEHAYFNTVYGNPYLCAADPTQPDDHALNAKNSTSLGVVAYDQLPKESISRQIYQSNILRKFVASILGIPTIYDYQCHLGSINIARMKQGDHLRWHFDLSDFVVSIPIQNADSGGIYEYIHHLKSDNDPNYTGVAKALKHDSADKKSLQTPPGSLILFQGKHTMHRVTEVQGSTDRYVLLLGFASEANIKGSDYLRQIRYGRIK